MGDRPTRPCMLPDAHNPTDEPSPHGPTIVSPPDGRQVSIVIVLVVLVRRVRIELELQLAEPPRVRARSLPRGSARLCGAVCRLIVVCDETNDSLVEIVAPRARHRVSVDILIRQAAALARRRGSLSIK